MFIREVLIKSVIIFFVQLEYSTRDQSETFRISAGEKRIAATGRFEDRGPRGRGGSFNREMGAPKGEDYPSQI